jgi:hypothetical protein
MAFRSALLRPQPARNRLWQVGGLVALILFALVLTNQFLPDEEAVTRSTLGLDFVPFYSAGRLVAEGKSDLLYDFAALGKYQREYVWPQIPDAKPTLGHWWNPPHFALPMTAFASMSFDEAVNRWTAINLICLLVCVALLVHFVRRHVDRSWTSWAIVPLLVIGSYPTMQALGHGQNTMISLLLLAGIALAWQGRRAVLAGILCGLLCYKPQLAALVGLMLVFTLGRRVLLSMLVVGLLTFAISEAFLPGAIATWIIETPGNLAAIQGATDYHWHRHVTIVGFINTLATDPSHWMPKLIASVARVAIFLGVLWQWWQYRWAWDESRIARWRVIAITIFATPLVMPFYFDYDLLLLAVGATLLAADMHRETRRTPFDSAVVWLGLLVVVLTPLSVMLSLETGIHILVIAQLFLFGTLLARSQRLADATAETMSSPLIAFRLSASRR